MNKLTISAVIAVATALGIWQREAIVVRWETRGMTEAEKQEFTGERELKEEGVIKADGTIEADAEFDAELNALEKELEAAGDDSELDEPETVE